MQHLHFDELPSSNDYAKAHFRELEDLTFVSASFQSAGKGRLGRRWSAHKGENLLFSITIKNRPMIDSGPFLSLVAAVAVTSALEEEYGVHASIKWPNDVYVNGRKVCGILLEAEGSDCLVIGIGINVNQTEFDGEYRIPPTSLACMLGHRVDLEAFREKLFNKLESALVHHTEKKRFLDAYRERDFLKGKKVSYEGETYIVEGVDDSFSLLLRGSNGIRPAISGEINLLP